MNQNLPKKSLIISLLVAVVGGLVVSIVSEVDLILRAVILDLIVTLAVTTYVLSEPWNNEQKDEEN